MAERRRAHQQSSRLPRRKKKVTLTAENTARRSRNQPGRGRSPSAACGHEGLAGTLRTFCCKRRAAGGDRQAGPPAPRAVGKSSQVARTLRDSTAKNAKKT